MLSAMVTWAGELTYMKLDFAAFTGSLGMCPVPGSTVGVCACILVLAVIRFICVLRWTVTCKLHP